MREDVIVPAMIVVTFLATCILPLQPQNRPMTQNTPPNNPKRSSESADRGHINLPGRNRSLPFSDAVLVGNTLYLAGRIGLDPATGKLPAAIDDELKYLFDGFQAVLQQAGMTMDDLVSVQIFAPDVSLWERFNTEYVKRFSKPALPARAFLGSGPLLFGAHFEMLGVAVKP